jgi:DNA modification methylase
MQGHVVADASVELIFTDLPYNRETIPQYGDLAKFAARVLIDGGSCICLIGNYALPEILSLMTPHLNFHWPLAEVHESCGAQMLPRFGVAATYKLMPWFVKGQRRTNNMVRDSVKSEPGLKTMHHPWAQGLAAPLYYIEQLSRKNSLVVDPYLGSGTTGVAALRLGRQFVGFEIDANTARKAEARILGTSKSNGHSTESTTQVSMTGVGEINGHCMETLEYPRCSADTA